MQGILAKWELCKSHAKDTIDVGQTDAAMATMMLGQTDDSFKVIDTDFADLSKAISYTASNVSTELYADAEWNKGVVILITLAGFLISTFVAVLIGRSIVKPIESVTDVMQRLSAGEINVEIGYRDRRDEIGRMVDAIDVFRKNIIERHAMEQRTDRGDRDRYRKGSRCTTPTTSSSSGNERHYQELFASHAECWCPARACGSDFTKPQPDAV